MKPTLSSLNFLLFLFPLFIAIGPLSTGHAAVKNIAWLQGDQLFRGSNNLNAGTPRSINWNLRASIDPEVFRQSFAESTRLYLEKDGDYLVSATLPIIMITGARANQSIEVSLGNRPVGGSLGQSGYIRNAGNHTESSLHVNVLVAARAGDYLELKTRRLNAFGNQTQMQTASMLVEYIEESRKVFSATSTRTVGGVNLNQDEFNVGLELQWTSIRQDEGYGHTGDSHEIILDEPGNYLVYFNLPLSSNVARSSVGINVMLDGAKIPAGRAEQGYIRNSNGHTSSSVHWSGLVSTLFPGQKLSFASFQRAAVGQVSLPTRKTASLFIENLDSTSGLFSTAAFGAGELENWNAPGKTAVTWLTPDFYIDGLIDNQTFMHEFDTSEQVIVRQDGSYLLVYNDNIEGTAARINPRITVEVNGTERPGAQTKTHYIRNSDGHIGSSATLVYLLENLTADDVVTVSTQQEANGGGAFSPFDDFIGGRLVLIKKTPFQPPVPNNFLPRLVSRSGNLFGFTIEIQDFGIQVDPQSVQAVLDGEPVDVDFQRDANGINLIQYQFPEIPPLDSVHQVELTYQDTSEPPESFRVNYSFRITTPFTELDPLWRVTEVDENRPGFVVNVTQIGTNVHGNSMVEAERQLAGLLSDPDTGAIFQNEATPSPQSGWVITPIMIDGVINWEQDELDAGNFTFDNGYEDQPIPLIPGWSGSTDGIVTEVLTFLELQKGFYTFGVNSDDGFKITSGVVPASPSTVVLGFVDGARGASDSLINVLVQEDGVYPFRLLWWEGGGGASLEFFHLHNGERILINDRNNENAIHAFQVGSSRPSIRSFSPPTGAENSTLEIVISNGTVRSDHETILLEIDGAAVSPAIRVMGDDIVVTFTPEQLPATGSHTVRLLYDLSSSPPEMVSHEFTFTITIPDPLVTPTVRILRNGNNIEVVYTGILQTATRIEGPYVDWPEIVSPWILISEDIRMLGDVLFTKTKVESP